jgi:rieske iron-sulfur protein
MSETPLPSPPGTGPGRRAVLKLALGIGLGLSGADLAVGQDGDPRKARPQPKDRFVIARGDRKGQIVRLADLPAGGPPLIAYPIDPQSQIVRDDSRLNEILLVRLLASSDVSADTLARAADRTVVAYSAVCTHTGCDVWDWQPASSTIRCPCHFSEFDLKDNARVLNGPAPRRLPALPLAVVDGAPVAAGRFVGRPGFEPGGG